MKLLSGILYLFLLASACHAMADETPGYIGDDINKLPLFDAHIHYNQNIWDSLPPEAIIKLMDDSGVAMGLVSSTPDEGTIALWQHAPHRIVPELRPYHGNAGAANWSREPGMFEYLEKRLQNHPHQGIGEFHLHDIKPEDHELLEKIVKVAISQGLFLHVHSDHKAVDYLYSLSPDLTILWAHAGMSEPAGTVGAMLAKYTTLYADTSYREYDILNEDGSIDADWRQVIETFPERFMIGSDTWVNSQWAEYRELIEINRRWLSQFTPDIAEKIAYKNAEGLFNRKKH